VQGAAGNVIEETPVTFPSGVLQIEGLLWLPEERPAGETTALPAGPYAGVVVCHPHPLRGGDMHNTVVAALAHGLQRAGLATLRFNFRGVGGSQGSYDDGRGEQDDARAALRCLAERLRALTLAVSQREREPRLCQTTIEAEPHAEGWRGNLKPETGNPQLVLAGYSFGAGVAITVAGDELLVGALIAVSPPTGRLDLTELQRPGLPKLFLAGSADPIAQAGPLQEATRLLPPPVACDIAPGVDHFWWGHEEWLVGQAGEFLARVSLP
jgi:alpha/beta superfamily hydrolase